mmetsp:Transcript_12846/g.37743  ORF Transcript_12846/g.37743 Transcript_12846/m.37743 type:complete len:148 (+) Transcript_12846:398-841(+)
MNALFSELQGAELLQALPEGGEGSSLVEGAAHLARPGAEAGTPQGAEVAAGKTPEAGAGETTPEVAARRGRAPSEGADHQGSPPEAVPAGLREGGSSQEAEGRGAEAVLPPRRSDREAHLRRKGGTSRLPHLLLPSVLQGVGHQAHP